MELQLCWDAMIPIRISLAPNEDVSGIYIRGSRPIYILVPRNLYLPLLSHRIEANFQHVLPTHTADIRAERRETWFDYQGRPLKWQYPVGVLFDLFVTDQTKVPWHITVHFYNFPEDCLMPMNEMFTSYRKDKDGLGVRHQFLNVLKEACHIFRGSGGSKAVMMMSEKEQDALWRAVNQVNLQEYKKACTSLGMGSSSQKSWTCIPIRILWCNARQEVRFTSRPMQTITQDGSAVLLRDALDTIGWWDTLSFGGMSEAVTAPALVILTNGITPPLDTPIMWLHQNGHAVDYFLYIIVLS
jgi:autophagy-related protein 5